MTHIRGLDGLRALAVLAVFAAHSGNVLFKAGAVGVDVFFVLSGYLITRLLLAEHDKRGTISIGRFLAKRAARLYPAMLLMLAAVTVGVLAAGTWSEELGWARIVSALTYLTDLWAVNVDPGGIVQHTWSLAVEEQFYLLWPIVVLGLGGRRRPVLIAASALSALSLLAMLITASGGVSAVYANHLAYFSPWTRGWALLLGCALACLPGPGQAPRDLLRHRVCAVLAVAALAATFVSGVVLDEQTGWQSVAAALGTAVLIYTMGSLPILVDLLETRPVRWLGERSYGFYLFHLPLLVLAEGFGTRRAEVMAIALVLTLVAVALSFRFVESPVREWGRRRFAPGSSRSTLSHESLLEGRA